MNNLFIIKIRIAMRITCLLLCLIVFQLHAEDVYFQKTKISLDIKNTTIEKVLQTIEEKSSYHFLYGNKLVNIDRKVSVRVKDATISDVMNELFKSGDIEYKIEGNQIILATIEKLREVVSGVGAAQQQRKIMGKVTDEKGDPLPGATITILGTTRGVITDVDGSYSIEAKPSDRLVFTFIGMESQIIDVGNQEVINVKMREKVEELEEVSVVAFGKQKKESVLSSIETVRPAELKVPSSNLTTALAGRMSGLISYQRSGEPGMDDADFFVRGVTTFAYAAHPLILIDGIEMSSADLARLQPDDIESFSILKDATATALYGARGANGVIMVTTKEGKEGKAQISFRYETSFSMPTKKIELADPITYMKLNNEAIVTRNPETGVEVYSDEKIEKTATGGNPYVYPATNWYDVLFRDVTINQRINFNVSGGGQIARYYIAGTFNQDNGVLKVDPKNNFNNNIDLKRYLLRSNVNINITNTTEAVVRLHGTFDDYMGPIDGGTGIYSKVMRTDPVLFPPYYEPDEQYQFVSHILFGNSGDGNYLNPYADMVRGYREYSRSLMLAQFEINQKLDFITKGLNFKGLFSTNRYSYFDVTRAYNPFYYSVGFYDKYVDKYTLTRLNPTTGTEWLSYSPGEKTVNSSTYIEAALNYDKTVSELHDISGLTVFTMRNYLTGNAPTLQLSLPYRNLGIAGRFTYSYAQKYFCEFNFGYNGSERFAKNERFGFFPSGGIAWYISNEPFWNNRIISKMKLKATYGLVGNDAIGSESDRFFYLSEVNLNDPSRGFVFGENFIYSLNGISISRYETSMIAFKTPKRMKI